MAITDLVTTLFHWPDGIVVGNLLASLLWVPIQSLGVHVRLKAHTAATHKRLDAQDAVLDNQNIMLEEMRQILRDLGSSDARLRPPDDSQ